VPQADSPDALGSAGVGLGYAGIRQAVAVEFDTYYNPQQLDTYENHVAVLTRGVQGPASSHHAFALGSTPNVPDLSEGVHVAKIVYSPFFDPQVSSRAVVVRDSSVCTPPHPHTLVPMQVISPARLKRTRRC
jgi:Bacterial lectin